MCARRPWASLPGMHHRTLTLSLELRVDDDTLTGHITTQNGAPHAFAGRLELLAAIEDAITSAPSDTQTEVPR